MHVALASAMCVDVAWRGQIAPVDSPESFRARPSRSSARDGSNAPFYCNHYPRTIGIGSTTRSLQRSAVVAQKIGIQRLEQSERFEANGEAVLPRG
jgi:hypothetical protein